MAENKMAEVAALFGKQPFREFWVKIPKETLRARFSNYGFETFNGRIWWRNGEILNKLITGKADIVDD